MAMVREGQKAPRFELEDDAGEVVRLDDFAGEILVLYFYPKDNTPGCTREAQAFSAASKAFAKAGARVVGVSKDSVKSHGGFRDKYALTFPLLSDPELTLHGAFGAYGEKTMYGKKVMGTIRSTFVIDRDGTIARVFPNVKVDGHADAVLAAVQSLGGAEKRAVKTAAKGAAPRTATKAPAKKAAPKKAPVKKLTIGAAAKAPAKKPSKAPAKKSRR